MKQNHHYLYKFLLGLLFGLGLIVSGMIYPAKVIGFLNVFGVWDPSLMFVMLGGIAVYAVLHFMHIRRIDTFLGYTKSLPSRKDIDTSLIVGAVLFGIGWGLVGYCPGPALVGFGTFATSAVVFVLSMLAGMYLYKMTSK